MTEILSYYLHILLFHQYFFKIVDIKIINLIQDVSILNKKIILFIYFYI